MNNEGLDKFDIEILNILKKDARASYSEIGEKVGLSRVAVKNRIVTLEKQGVIKGYKTIIEETKAVISGVSYILDMECTPDEYENVITALARYKFIRKIYSTTGKCRLHCEGFAANQITLDHQVNHLFRNIKGIREMSWHILLSTLKDVDGGVEYDRCKEPEHLEK